MSAYRIVPSQENDADVMLGKKIIATIHGFGADVHNVIFHTGIYKGIHTMVYGGMDAVNKYIDKTYKEA